MRRTGLRRSLPPGRRPRPSKSTRRKRDFPAGSATRLKRFPAIRFCSGCSSGAPEIFPGPARLRGFISSAAPASC